MATAWTSWSSDTAYSDWLDWERIVINVDAVYREIDPSHEPTGVMDLFRGMAELKQRK